jgi:hypothetical protein
MIKDCFCLEFSDCSRDRLHKSSTVKEQQWCHESLKSLISSEGSTEELPVRAREVLVLHAVLSVRRASEGTSVRDNLQSAAALFTQLFSPPDRLPTAGTLLEWCKARAGKLPAHQQAGHLEDSVFAGFSDWLKTLPPNADTRAVQCVVDLFLHFVAGTDSQEITASLEQHQLLHLAPRCRSLQAYAIWSSRLDDQSPVQRLFVTPDRPPICVPVLLDVGGNGVVVWLTVELFRDGLVGFIPDFLTLGLTDIFRRDEQNSSFLDYADEVWQLSGLPQRGFSARWRLLHRPPLAQHFFHHTRSAASGWPDELKAIIGPSAQAAFLTALLAASGQNVHSHAESDSPQWMPTPLNPAFSITATVKTPPTLINQSDDAVDSCSLDPLNLRLGTVGGLNAKLGVVSRYSQLEPDHAHNQRLESMLVSAEDFDDPANSVIQAAETQRQNFEQAAVPDGHRASIRFHGVWYRPVGTIQEALDWMLQSNRWREAFAAAERQKWESRWGYPRNSQGLFIDRDENVILDEYGQPVRDPNHPRLKEKSAVTGSLEFAESPWGGADCDPLQELQEQIKKAKDAAEKKDHGDTVV